MTESTFLHNTKISCSTFNEDKALEKKQRSKDKLNEDATNND